MRSSASGSRPIAASVEFVTGLVGAGGAAGSVGAGSGAGAGARAAKAPVQARSQVAYRSRTRRRARTAVRFSSPAANTTLADEDPSSVRGAAGVELHANRDSLRRVRLRVVGAVAELLTHFAATSDTSSAILTVSPTSTPPASSAAL